jgi:hypothetical protein
VPSAAPGETFTMSVNMLVTEPGGITFSGADIGLTYDAAKFSVTSVAAGDLTTGNGFISLPDFATPGVIKFTASTPTDNLAKAFNSQGTILTATFEVKVTATAGSSLINITETAAGVATGLYDGSPFRNNLVINPAVTDGNDSAAGVDALFSVVDPVVDPAAHDVNRDGDVTPLDALLIIIELNSSGPHALPTPPPSSPPFFDVSGDNQVTPLDALLVINYLNDPLSQEPPAEGEPIRAGNSDALEDAELWLAVWEDLARDEDEALTSL